MKENRNRRALGCSVFFGRKLYSTDLQVKNWQFGKIPRQYYEEG